MDKLNAKYQKLMKESHTLSTIDRAKSDEKVAEAEAVIKQIEALKQQ